MKLSNLEKIYWPKEKITKGELLEYYAQVAPLILPYLKGRPIAMRRYPEGIEGISFFQKDVHDVPSFVKTVQVVHSQKKVNYLRIENLKSLLYVVNLGSIEIHTFHSRIRTLDKPDYLLLDLDPEAISFKAVIDTALEIHTLLEEEKIPHFCKTSGGRGLHILVPLRAKYTYEKARAWASEIAQQVHERLPKITSLERAPSKRQKRVYIDTLQNARGQLMAAPYSVRAKPGAPVSTPLDWKEVRYGLDPKEFNLRNALERFKKKGDLLKGLL